MPQVQLTPDEQERRRRREMGLSDAINTPLTEVPDAPAVGETTSSLSARVAGAESGAPVPPPQKEPSAAEQTPGSSPPGESPVGGVTKTVTDTEKKVNAILPKRPSSSNLMSAVAEYEKASAQLREQSVDTTAIDQSLADAKQAYKERADRNEMLSLVQMVAQGFAKLAAYNYGAGKGRYIADQVTTPSVDYEKRTDRAADEYKMERADANERRRVEMDRADKRYQISKDRRDSLRERIGAEENRLGRETSMYGAELSAASQADSDAARNGRDNKRDADTTARDAAREYDNAQQEESLLNRITSGLKDPKRTSKQDLTVTADQLGVPEEEQQAAYEAAKSEEMFGEPSQSEINAKLLPVIQKQLRENLAVIRARKEAARARMSPSGATPATSQQTPPPAGRTIRAKKTGEVRPYSDATWNAIQAGPEAADFEILGE